MLKAVRLSMTELDAKVMKSKNIYIEAENCEGLDFSHLMLRYLSVEQPAGAVKFSQNPFIHSIIINLKDEETAIEMPVNDKFRLSKEQKRFEKFLVFKPGNLDLERLGGFREKKGDNDMGYRRPGIRFQ